MTLEEVLSFVRGADRDTWQLVVRERQMALKRRDEEAIRRLSVGDSAIFEPPSGQALQGQIITIGRSRVVLAVRSDQDGFLQRVSVPAGLVRQLQ